MGLSTVLQILLLVGICEYAQCLTSAEVSGITEQIDDILEEDFNLLGGFVRLSFHDCVGVTCDGCINVNNTENAGLQTYIDTAELLYTDLKVDGVAVVMSRADFWALLGIRAYYFSVGRACRPCDDDDIPAITFRTGRADCATSPYTDDIHEFPNAVGDGDEMLDFFEKTFDFNAIESVAILGAHTLGTAKRANSGFGGPWVSGRNRFDNEFYRILANSSFNWEQDQTPRSFGSKAFWKSNEEDGGRKLMLNTDMALYLNISSMAADGMVECTFDTCPLSSTAIWVKIFAEDNDLFLEEFAAAFEKMIEHGADDLTEVQD